LNSCLSLKRIGANPDKVIPWDWPALVTPDAEVKSLSSDGAYELLYVGMVSESKGIGDVVRAVGLLRESNLRITLKVVGDGEISFFKTLAKKLEVDDRVSFLGLLPHERVIEAIRGADLMVVPSRHEYGEGLPMTIYETLCARTPIVASDHPMFRANLTHDLDALIFPAGDAASLAAAITKVLSDPDLYQRLSSASAQTWAQLQLPVKWAESLRRWISDSPEDRDWLFDHRLSSGIYPLHRYEQ
jgi:glycosyltransferase involved in cell wall biosynthesis